MLARGATAREVTTIKKVAAGIEVGKLEPLQEVEVIEFVVTLELRF